MADTGSTILSKAATLLLLTVAVGVTATTAFFSWRGSVPFPEPELLTILDDLRHFGVAHAIWKPIEGHRMVIPRVLQLTDYRAFGGTNLFTLVVAWAMNALAFLWTFAATTEELGRDRVLRAATLCLGAILVFGPYYTIFAHGQHVNFVVAWFLSVVSICIFLAGCRRGRAFNAWHGAAVVLGWMAGLSLLPGLFVWPVQVYLALVDRNWKLLLAVVACSLPIFAVQAAGSQVGGAEQVLALLADPSSSIAWISRYVGSIFGQALFFEPLSRASGVVAIGLGVLGLIVVAALSLWLLWRPHTLPAGTRLTVGVSFLATLWIVGAAAKHPEAEGLLERYFFVVGWFWFALVPLMIVGLKGRRLAGPLALAVTVAAILGLGPNHALTSLRVDAQGSLFQAAKIAVVAGVDDPQLYGSFLLSPPRDRLWEEMRRRREPPFDSTPLVERADVTRLRACAEGSVEHTALPSGGWRLGGDLPGGARLILVLDDSAAIMGIGRRWRAPIASQFFPIGVSSVPGRERWWGYARGDPADLNIAIVAFDGASIPLCRFGEG